MGGAYSMVGAHEAGEKNVSKPATIGVVIINNSFSSCSQIASENVW